MLRRWQRPLQSTPLEAEVAFFVHRDGKWLAYDSDRNGNLDIFKVAFNGAGIEGDPVALTTDAAPSVAPVHERMPVVLDFHAYDDWLDPALQDAARALAERIAMVPEPSTTSSRHSSW